MKKIISHFRIPLKFVPKPWGKELWFAQTRYYAGKILFIKKGARLSLQYHRSKDETIYLLRGKLKVTIGKKTGSLKIFHLDRGSALRIPPGTIHRFQALCSAEIFEVSTAQLNDVVRLEDDYQRA